MDIQVDTSMPSFNLMLCSREKPLGILEHAVTLAKGVTWPKKMLKELGWRLLSRIEAHN